jgi:16S rRNA (adenine(1408)-N(1))-methyltransferase
VVVDIGTGSGTALLRRAAREPQTLFFALDADASAMAEASRRSARRSRRGGLTNVVFVVAAAETLPGDLSGMADEVTIALPWGSLLRAALDPGSDAFDAIAACARPDGLMTLLLSSLARDAASAGVVLDAPTATALARNYETHGYSVLECRPATRADVDELSSGWGRRLGIPERRPAWLFRLRGTRSARTV